MCAVVRSGGALHEHRRVRKLLDRRRSEEHDAANDNVDELPTRSISERSKGRDEEGWVAMRAWLRLML